MEEVNQNGRFVVNLGNEQCCLPVVPGIGSKTILQANLFNKLSLFLVHR